MDSNAVGLEKIHVKGLQENQEKMSERDSSVFEVKGVVVSLRGAVSNGTVERIVRATV